MVAGGSLLNDDGSRALRSDGTAALLNASDECDECCVEACPSIPVECQGTSCESCPDDTPDSLRIVLSGTSLCDTDGCNGFDFLGGFVQLSDLPTDVDGTYDLVQISACSWRHVTNSFTSVTVYSDECVTESSTENLQLVIDVAIVSNSPNPDTLQIHVYLSDETGAPFVSNMGYFFYEDTFDECCFTETSYNSIDDCDVASRDSYTSAASAAIAVCP